MKKTKLEKDMAAGECMLNTKQRNNRENNSNNNDKRKK